VHAALAAGRAGAAVVRAAELDRWERGYLADLPERVAKWRAGHPAGTLREAAADLKLWRTPDDRDVHWHLWNTLKTLDDPAAAEGFPAMRAAAKAAKPCA